jgi:hypothetical protein
MAWLYHPIAEHPSSSSDKVYTVCIREDDRIRDADARRQAAILTCCCPGWTRRCPGGTDESRTCRHVEQELTALRLFKKAKSTQPAAKPQTAPILGLPVRVRTQTGGHGNAVPATASRQPERQQPHG